jgi:hypothetical protein
VFLYQIWNIFSATETKQILPELGDVKYLVCIALTIVEKIKAANWQ